jgi:N6-L-threonylcarbamoyladenine synthase
MLVLGIESSCDETAAGVVDLDGPRMLSNVVASQHATHAEYGGVVPEFAAREHLKNLPWVLEGALKEAGVSLKQLQGLAVTRGPGLAGCLHLGVAATKGLALASGLPFIGVDHLEGHLLAAFLEHPGLRYPFLGLLVSGGHTALYDVRGPFERRRLFGTRDDAAGEAFDKVAKLLELGFPGGPALDRLAQTFAGTESVVFPQSQAKDGSADFSYSGLKTAVRTYLEKTARNGAPADTAAVAAAFQKAAIEPLIRRAVEAALGLGYTQVVAGGGVAANSLFRQALPAACEAQGLQALLSSPALCADNGAMIAYAGGLRLQAGQHSPLDLGIDPNLETSSIHPVES